MSIIHKHAYILHNIVAYIRIGILVHCIANNSDAHCWFKGILFADHYKKPAMNL